MGLIKLDIEKTIIPELTISYFLDPDYVYIPLDKKDILVQQNELVTKNQELGKNIYSPVSGKAFGIKKCNILNENKNTLVIQNDFRELTKNKESKISNLTILKIINALKKCNNSNLVSKLKSNKTFDSIVITAIDENPYVYNKIYGFKENIIDLLDFLQNISVLYNCKEILIVIKNKDAFVIDECLNIIGTYPNIKLTLVEDEYLISCEEVLKEKLRIGKQSLFLDIEDVIDLQNLLSNKKSTTELITISGNAIVENKVCRVKKYTLLNEVLNKFITINEDNYDIIINGLMTGFKLNEIKNFVITEDIKSITIMKKEKRSESKCIKCGKCISICPNKVNPITLKNIEKCIHCGLCSYICPSNINLREKLKEYK